MSSTLKRISAVLAVALAGLGGTATVAHADLAFEPGSVTGEFSSQQAGAHSDFHTSFSLTTDSNGTPTGSAKEIVTDLPTGVVGNPTATPKCTASQVADPFGWRGMCPMNTVVGEVTYVIGDGSGGGAYPPYTTFVYSVEPYADQPAALMFFALAFSVRIDTTVRSDGSYNIQSSVSNVSEGQPLISSDVTLWGVPADHQGPGPLSDLFGASYGGPLPGAPRRAFLTNPSTCDGGPLVTTYNAVPWIEQATPVAAAMGESPAQTGCEKQAFEPELDVRPGSFKAGAPSGYRVDIDVPQPNNPDGLATPPVKDVDITFPQGTAISPSAADGLQACSDEQVALKSKAAEQCPDGSKIGTVDIETPVLDDPLSGSLYVGSQQSDDPQSGKMFRLFLTAEGSGVRIKLEGGVKADPNTGQLTASFHSNPELPFSKLSVALKGGNRAALVNPTSCGEKTTTATMTSWGGQTANLQSTFDIACPTGLDGFTPAMDAGTMNPVAGAFSPFALGIAKPDGQAAINGLDMKLPEGLLANLKGNVGKQVGSVTAFSGPGSNPFPLPGKVFLEGPYGDAPYSLRVVVPAKAGPYDLGDVVVRQKIYVDRTTAQVRVVSDPIPTIVKGVPVGLQRLHVDIDKPGFVINPTSCAKETVSATLAAISGQTAALTNRFQVGSCSDLAFKPKLALALTGRKQTRTGDHPGVKAKVRQPGIGAAAIAKAKVVVPKSIALDPDNAQALCEYADGTKPDLENHCPKGSIVGRARAKTPLLNRDLTGDVYFVKNVRKDKKTGNTIRTLPMIVVALRGEIAINLRGEASTTKSGQLVNTFANVPDAPISAFNLNIQGGDTGILAVTRTRKSKINLCTNPNSHTADVDMNGHNGKRANFATTVKTPCAKTKKARKK